VAWAACPPFAAADQPLGKIQTRMINLTFLDHGLVELRMAGEAGGLGDCVCYGQFNTVPGGEPGVLEGTGVVAFTAANGDVLVGVIDTTVYMLEKLISFEIHWRDEVTFSDGTTVESTGRFVHNKPAGIIMRFISY
jgi:hypothetical protein